MSCLCGGSKPKGSYNQTQTAQRNNLKSKIKKFYDLKLKDDVIEDLTEKFDQHATEKYGIKI